MVKKCRENGIDSELYPSKAKMQKQMKYANDRGVQFVAIVGDEEIEKEIIKLKNMESGEQFEVTIDQLIEKLK